MATQRLKPELGLLLLRVALGLVFFVHGWMKLVSEQISFTRELLLIVGWQLPDWLLWTVAVVEIVAGLALITGLFARPAALVMALEMLAVAVMFHAKQGFFIVAVPNAPLAYGFEYHVALIGGLLCLVFCGPGAWVLRTRGAGQGETTVDLAE